LSAWEPFRDVIPESERGCFVDAYKKRLNSNDMETQVSVSVVFFSQLAFLYHFLPSHNKTSLNISLVSEMLFHLFGLNSS